MNAGDTLQDIRDKINNLTDSTGVQASVIKVSPTESTLIFTSTSEGEDNRISFSDDTGAVLQNLGVLSDPTTINAANVIDGGNNALIKLDGVTVSRSSNEFSDLVDGLSISLYDAEPGTKIKIDVEQDLNQAKTAIVGFVDAYNAVQSFINEKHLLIRPQARHPKMLFCWAIRQLKPLNPRYSKLQVHSPKA